jgi:hypothetical protein
MIATPFQMPKDGFYHISAVGEFPHHPTGLVQVVDPESLDAIVRRFAEASATPNFPGILIDFDHASLDQDKPTEAAGWIVALDKRPDGLWAQIRWSDRGEQAVRGGRYRFISPVWHRDECVELGEKRVRPTRLINCAVTNDPNIPGLVPLSNSARPLTDEQLRAIHAKRGGGGGEPASVAPSAPSEPEVQEELTSPRLDMLRQLRAEMESTRPNPQDRPQPPHDPREVIDPKAAFHDTLRRTNDLNAAWAAKKEAEDRARANKAALDGLRRQLRDAGVADREKQNKAIDKHIKDLQRRYEQDRKAFDRAFTAAEKTAQKLDLEIAQEETRLADAEARRTDKMTAAEQAEERARLRAQVAADKEAERRRRAEEADRLRKEREAEELARRNDPATRYRSEVARRRTYWDALERGDVEFATKMYPDADHRRNLADLESLKPTSGSKASDKVYLSSFAELRQQAP